MPNGECPIGAANKTAIAAQGRELGEIKARQDKQETTIEELVVMGAVQAWKIGVIIGVIVALLSPVGQALLGPVVANLINGGGQ